MAKDSVNQVSYAVNKPYIERSMLIQIDLYCFIGNKLRLRGHNRFSAGTLRKFIHGTYFFILIVDVGQNLKIHELFYKGRFAASDRAHYANINITVRTLGNIFV